ncbi:hypothetical protein J4E91_001857 [Alternaria rosae]|nr:hypothetical protein J4E91_001857 [Alternaria rosae]
MRAAFMLRVAALLALPFVSAQDDASASIISLNASHGCPNISPGPVSFSYLAEQFTLQAHPDPTATESIRQTLSLYALAIDGRNYDILRKVFTTNARANYSDPIGVLNGVQAIIDNLAPGLSTFVSTQHHLGTQMIHICGPSSAVSVTYFQATHYFTPYTGVQNPVDNSKVLIDKAQYQDTWAKQKDGSWKIINRNLVRMVRFAFSVFVCFAFANEMVNRVLLH